MNTNMNSTLSVNFLIEEGDNEEESQRIIKKLEQVLLKEKQKTEKVAKVSTNTQNEKNFESIEKVFNNFLAYYRKTNNVKENTFKEYETSFKYMFLFYDKNDKVYDLEDIEKWLEYRDLLTTLPNNTLRRYKEDLDLDDVIYGILTDNDKKGKETTLLNAKTINKHFITYNQFLNYLVLFKKIKSNPIEKLSRLSIIENPHNSFTEDELSKLFDNTKDNEIKNFFQVLLYTGMRLSSVLKIKKEHISLKDETLIIVDDKTLSGQRKITIHKKILKIFMNYINSNDNHIFFKTNHKDSVQKKINRHIKNILKEHRTIHSFRKNFTQKLFNICEDINLRKYIIGHSQLRDITFTTYNQEKININKISKIINKITYEKDKLIFSKEEEIFDDTELC